MSPTTVHVTELDQAAPKILASYTTRVELEELFRGYEKKGYTLYMGGPRYWVMSNCEKRRRVVIQCPYVY